MSIEVQQGFPQTLTIGDAASFKITDADFPASSWTSRIVFKDPSGSVVTFSGSQSGEDHLFELSNSDTGTLKAGENLVCLQFEDGTNRQSTDWVTISVLADPATATPPTYAEQQVSFLETVIQRFNGSGFTTVNFNGQSFTRANVPDYQKQLTYWRAEVVRERKAARAARGLPNHRHASPVFCKDDSISTPLGP